MKLPFDTAFLNPVVSIISALLTTIAAYYNIKHSLVISNKLDVKKRQFNNVYLPLYKKFCIDFSDNISRQTLQQLNTKLSILYHEHHELIFPEMYDLIDKFSSSLQTNSAENIKARIEYFKKIQSHIMNYYETLKYDLGYPTNSNSLKKYNYPKYLIKFGFGVIMSVLVIGLLLLIIMSVIISENKAGSEIFLYIITLLLSLEAMRAFSQIR